MKHGNQKHDEICHARTAQPSNITTVKEKEFNTFLKEVGIPIID